MVSLESTLTEIDTCLRSKLELDDCSVFLRAVQRPADLNVAAVAIERRPTEEPLDGGFDRGHRRTTTSLIVRPREASV
jgi:hypothetical protein